MTDAAIDPPPLATEPLGAAKAPAQDVSVSELAVLIQQEIEALAPGDGLAQCQEVLARLSSLLADLDLSGKPVELQEVRTLVLMARGNPKGAGDLIPTLAILEERIYRRRFSFLGIQATPGLFMGAGILFALALLFGMYWQFAEIFGPIAYLFEFDGDSAAAPRSNGGIGEVEGKVSMRIIVTAGFTGAIISLFIRINGLKANYDRGRMQYLLDGATRPFIGATFAVIIALAFKSGLMGVEISKESEGAFLLIAAFLCGFSERFSRDLVTKLESRVQVTKP